MANKHTMSSDIPGGEGTTTDQYDRLQEHQQAWEEFGACAVQMIPVLKAQMAAVTEETERSAMELLVHLRLLASLGPNASEDDRGASLSKIVIAMQFQDITRQKLEHVGQALDQWSIQLHKLMRGAGETGTKRRISVLERIKQNYTMEEERRLHAATISPDYQEPVPIDIEEPEAEQDRGSVTLF
ncbi:MAG: hypothetical protein OEY86_09445 [Nitrospira sp.]|nr:hypothetical protein [Nitrospira sp.]